MQESPLWLVEGNETGGQQIDPFSLSLWCALVSFWKTSPYVQREEDRKDIKNWKWGSWSGGCRRECMWEQETWLAVIRTPLCRNPTASLWTVLGKTRACIWEEQERNGENHAKRLEWDLLQLWGPMTNQTMQHIVCFRFLLSASIPQPFVSLWLPTLFSLFCCFHAHAPLFPLLRFPSFWCEMNIKVVLWQLGRPAAESHWPPWSPASSSRHSNSSNSSFHYSTIYQGGNNSSLQGETPEWVRGNLRELALRSETKILLLTLLWVK